MKKSKNLKASKAHSRDVSSHSYNKNNYFRSSQSSLSYKRNSLKHTRENLDDKKKKNHRRNTFTVHPSISTILSGVIIFLIVSVLFYASSITPSGSSVALMDSSYSFRDTTEYESYIDEYVSSNILARSKLFFPLSDFNEAFTQKFPEVTSIKTKVPFADRSLQVVIMTPPPLFKVIGSYESEYTKFIDANGTVISANNKNKDENLPTLTVDTSSLTEIGSQLLTQNEVTILTLLSEEISPNKIRGLPGGFEISSATLDVQNGRLEVAFNKVKYIARFSTYADARNQVGALKAILTELYAEEGEEKPLPTEYIDVRVYEKVFIR